MNQQMQPRYEMGGGGNPKEGFAEPINLRVLVLEGSQVQLDISEKAFPDFPPSVMGVEYDNGAA